MSALDSIPTRLWCGLAPKIDHGRFTLSAKCDDCGSTQDWRTARLFEPSVAVARVRKAGWRTGRKVVCPTCQAKPKPVKKEIAVMPSPVTPIRPEPAPEATPAARLAKRLAIAALEEGYDERGLCYLPGNTDASIAKAVGCAESVVAKIRDEYFGPAGAPGEFAELAAKLGEARAALDAMLKNQVAELNSLSARQTADRKALGDRITAISGEFDRVALKNGWKR